MSDQRKLDPEQKTGPQPRIRDMILMGVMGLTLADDTALILVRNGERDMMLWKRASEVTLTPKAGTFNDYSSPTSPPHDILVLL